MTETLKNYTTWLSLPWYSPPSASNTYLLLYPHGVNFFWDCPNSPLNMYLLAKLTLCLWKREKIKITLSERSLSQKVTNCTIPFVWNVHNRQIQWQKVDRLVVAGCVSELNLNRHNKIPLWGDENVWDYTGVMAVQPRECTKNYSITYFY